MANSSTFDSSLSPTTSSTSMPPPAAPPIAPIKGDTNSGGPAHLLAAVARAALSTHSSLHSTTTTGAAKQQRGYHSCIRCKRRKQRCEPCPPSELPPPGQGPQVGKEGELVDDPEAEWPKVPCMNCIENKLEKCIYVPRTDRGNKKKRKDHKAGKRDRPEDRMKADEEGGGIEKKKRRSGASVRPPTNGMGASPFPAVAASMPMTSNPFGNYPPPPTSALTTGPGGEGMYYDLPATSSSGTNGYGIGTLFGTPSTASPWMAPHPPIPRNGAYSSTSTAGPPLYSNLAAYPSAHLPSSLHAPSAPNESPSAPTGTGDDGTSGSSDSESEVGPGQSRPWGADAARGVAFLSLNASGSPVYVGPSSGFSWAKLVLAGVAAADRPIQVRTPNGATRQHMSSREFQRSQFPPVESNHFTTVALANDALRDVPHEVAEVIFRSVYRHVQPRYPFPDWLLLHEYWQNRDDIMREAALPNASRDACTGAFFVWILFAIGSRLVQKQNIPSLASPEAYYAKAMAHLEVIVGLHDLRNAQALMFMVMYAFRASDAPSVWFLVGIIVRLCISLGLHRELRGPRAARVSPYQLQLRRRIFWTAYTLDRMLAMSLGRPCGIADRDIDISLPYDVDCVSTNPKPEDAIPGKMTSMTSSLHLIELKRIESLIQKNTYRVDRPTLEPPDELLAKLDDWERRIPAAANDPNGSQLPCVERDLFMSRSTDAKLYLLRPLTVTKDADPAHVKLLAECAAESCMIHKRLHQSPRSVIALESLRSCFLSGLTLLHAVRVKRDAIPVSTLQKAIRSTSNTMFAYAQHFRAAQAFHEAFEDLAQAVLEYIETPEIQPSSGDRPTAPSDLPRDAMSQLVGETPTAGQADVWYSLQAEMPDMMNAGTQDTFVSMLESLGVPMEGLWVDEPSGFGAWNMGGGDMGMNANDLFAFGL